MKINIEVTSIEEAATAIAVLQGFVAGAGVQTTTDNPVPVAEKPKAVKAKAAPKVAKKEVEETNEDEATAGYTIDDVREKAKELIGAGNRDAVKEILDDLGVDRVTKLTEAQYAEFIDAANAL